MSQTYTLREANDLAVEHVNAGKLQTAVDILNQVLALAPDYAEAHNNRGVALLKLKLYKDSLASFDQAVGIRPDYAEAYHNKGLVLLAVGDIAGAQSAHVRALSLKPDYASALLSLTQTQRYENADHPDAIAIRALLNNAAILEPDRERLLFALGKILDDCGRFDDAFAAISAANDIRNRAVRYRPEEITRLTEEIIQVFSREFLARPFAGASTSGSPLFIVGMPRSGTTLAASLLSNHPAVGSAGELTALVDIARQMADYIGEPDAYPRAAGKVGPSAAGRMAADYEARLRRDLHSDIPIVVDKNPLNFRHLGFAAKLFPNARFVHVTRDRGDTCLSNYFQRFTQGFDYSWNLDNTAHFYSEYVKVMEHWQNALPIEILEMRYEDMVSQTEETAREALGRLGLSWDPRCASPHTNPYPVETASNWQVRQPIYQRSVGRWRNYEKHLGGLVGGPTATPR